MTERRIRVLQVITRLVTRGASRHVIDLARSLDPCRFEVEVLAGRGEDYEGSLWDVAEATGLRCHRVETLQRQISPWTDLLALRAILATLRGGAYDIVHTHVSKAGLLGRVAARLARVPVVVHTYHGVVGEIAGNGVQPRFLRVCERGCDRLTDGVIAISQHVAEQFEVAGILGAGRCNVIHNGLDLNYYKGGQALSRPTELTNGPVIGTVGSLTTEKGTADLLRAVVGLCEDNPDLTICAVGDGPLRAALETLARQLGIAQQVLFVGVVEDVRPWIASFDVFALPSRSEGMGRVLVEAMALGCPIVATDVGGIREAVGDAARLAEPGNPARLGEMLGQLLENREMRCQLVEAGQERAKRFSLDEMASRTADLYENCLALTRAA